MKRLSTSVSAFVERIKINHVWREVRGERVFWFKRRRSVALPVLAGANVFFRFAGAPMQTLTGLSDWQRWETDSFLGLHGGDGFQAFTQGERTIGAEEVPGINVTIPLDNGNLTPQIAAAVGRELCRAHSWVCPGSSSPWSHSDPHAGNFIYEPETDRARIIDFEVMHHPHLPSEDRHADDVLIFLQDIVGRIRAEQWIPCAQAFLDGYDRAEIVERVMPQLNIPRNGAARLWWRVRTSFLPMQELQSRLQALLATQIKVW
ncbi:hypothetical protein ACXR0O_04295 [Verrucomicrobiota bacterium sgz303538]